VHEFYQLGLEQVINNNVPCRMLRCVVCNNVGGGLVKCVMMWERISVMCNDVGEE